MVLTPENRVSWLMTGLIAGGVASTVSLSVGVMGQDETLTILGAIGEVLTIAVSLLVLLICARGAR